MTAEPIPRLAPGTMPNTSPTDRRPTRQLPELLSIAEAARILRISERKVYLLVKGGELPAVRLGKRCLRFDAADLAAFVERSKTSK